MSITFPTEYQSNFPDSIDTFARMEDISPEDLPFLVEYYRLMNIGNFNAAKQLILSNPQLNTKFMNADKWNQIRDAIIAVQKYFMTYGFTSSGTQTRGTWNLGVNYLMGDSVSHNNILWQAVDDNINSEPSDGNPDWIKILPML